MGASDRQVIRLSAAVLVILAATGLAACGGSQSSSRQDFASAVRSACKEYAVRRAAVFRIMDKADGWHQQQIHELDRITDRWLGELRKLTPPASTGVSGTEWRKVLDAMRRDGRASDAFFATEFPKLLRSLKKRPPTSKLPPGTGPTAAILAQAFESPEGRRYLRLQKRLEQQAAVDSKRMGRIGRRVGMDQACVLTPGPRPAGTSSQRTHP